MELLKNLITLLEASNGLLETYCERFKDQIPQQELSKTLEGIEMVKLTIIKLKEDALDIRFRSEGRLN